MAVRLSALRAGRPFTPRKIPGTHFCYATSTHRRTFSAWPRVGMCRQCARPRARNVRHSGRVRATMRLMSVFLSASKDLLSLEWQASGVITMCGRVHSPTNIRWIIRGRIFGECVRRCVEVALEAESIQGRSAAGRIRSIWKIGWPHRESNPRPSGL
jgi:hypothetical protein